MSDVTTYSPDFEPQHRPQGLPADVSACAATAPGLFPFACTEPKGHDGDHYADGVTRLCAQWPAASA